MPTITPINEEVIELIRERREMLGWSQQQMADALQVDSSYISKVENYRSRYSLSRINDIAKIMRCSIYDFLPDNTVNT